MISERIDKILDLLTEYFIKLNFNRNKQKFKKIYRNEFVYFFNDTIAKEINIHGIYEKDEINLISEVLKSKGNIVDIGANIGNHSLAFSRISKKVYSFDAHPRIFEILKFNTKESKNIKIFNLGLSDRKGFLFFNNNKSTNMGGKKLSKTGSIKSKIDKLDNIISLLKDCDRRVEILDKEEKEIKEAKDSWKKKKEQIAGIIKFCFQTNLIESKLNGNKYQATIANNSPKVQEDMDLWNDVDKERYGITKRTTVTRNSDGTVISQKEEVSADKDRLKADLQQKLPGTPASAQLLQVVRLSYGRRKRIS